MVMYFLFIDAIYFSESGNILFLQILSSIDDSFFFFQISGCMGDTQFHFRIRQCPGKRPLSRSHSQYNKDCPVSLQVGHEQKISYTILFLPYNNFQL